MSSSRNIRQSPSTPRSTTAGLRYHRSQLSHEMNGLSALNFEQNNFNNHISSNNSTPNNNSSTMNTNRNSTSTSNDNNNNINNNNDEMSSDSMRHAMTWKMMNVSGIVPPARSGAASVIVGSKLYMFGGYGGGTGRLDDFYSFSFETNTWEEVEVLSTAKPGCRENNGVVIGDSSRVYLFGGYNGQAWLNDLWTFDIQTKCWTCLQESSDDTSATDTNTTTARPTIIRNNNEGRRLSISVHEDRDHFGNPNAGSLLHQEILSVSNNENNHSGDDDISVGIEEEKIPSRRFGYVSVVHNNKFILWGGFDGNQWLNDMYEFDFERRKWREIRARGQLPSVRSCPAWCKDDKRVYIHGGYDGVERKSDFYSCDLSSYTWTEMPSKGTPPSPRYFHSCCLYDDKMFTYAGYSGSERLSDMYCYDFKTKFWSQIDCNYGQCPSGRSSLVAQVYDNHLFVFGGYNGETVLNDFYKFRLKAVSIPSSNYMNDMLRLINNPELSDVTFLVEGKEVYANRAILAGRSEYFHALLFSGCMRESIQTSSEAITGVPTYERKPIEIQDISYEVFIKLLEYIYTDCLKSITLETGIQLLISSEKFLLDRLKAMCEDAIRSHVTVDNVSGILLTSHQHNATGLKEIALEFILTNLKAPTIMKSLSDLKSEPDLLIEIIRRNAQIQPQSISVQQTPLAGPFSTSEMWNGSRR